MTAFYKEPKEEEKVKPVGIGQDDMVNILLTMNYLWGFSKYIADASKKTEANTELEPMNSNNSDSDAEEELEKELKNLRNE